MISRRLRARQIVLSSFGSFLIFPLGKDREIGIVLSRRFIGAWHGFGED